MGRNGYSMALNYGAMIYFVDHSGLSIMAEAHECQYSDEMSRLCVPNVLKDLDGVKALLIDAGNIQHCHLSFNMPQDKFYIKGFLFKVSAYQIVRARKLMLLTMTDPAVKNDLDSLDKLLINAAMQISISATRYTDSHPGFVIQP